MKDCDFEFRQILTSWKEVLLCVDCASLALDYVLIHLLFISEVLEYILSRQLILTLIPPHHFRGLAHVRVLIIDIIQSHLLPS